MDLKLGDTFRIRRPHQAKVPLTDHLWAICGCPKCEKMRDDMQDQFDLITIESEEALEFWRTWTAD